MELCDFIKSQSRTDVLVKLILMMPSFCHSMFDVLLLNIPVRVLISIPAI